MAQYIVSATLQSEEAANQLLLILMRRGLTTSTLGARRDPVSSGSHGALVLLVIDTSEPDIKSVNKFVRECVKQVDWISLVVLPAEGVLSLLWTCRGEQRKEKPAAPANGTPALELPDDPEFNENEDEWFAQGANLEYAQPAQEE
jgi:hypothetical protein